MKSRHKVIICLALMGILIFGIVQFVVIPENVKRQNKYLADQKNPVTHDLNSIMKYKNKYMGNASNIINLFHSLPLSDVNMTFELFPDNLTLKVNYNEAVQNINEDKVNEALIYNSTAAFTLIDNLEAIEYNFTDSDYKVTRSDVEKWYGGNIQDLLKNEEWKAKVQDKLKDKDYVSECVKALLKHK